MLASTSSCQSLNIVISDYAKTSGQSVKEYKASLYSFLKITSSYELTNSQIQNVIKELNLRIETLTIYKLAQILINLFQNLISKIQIKIIKKTFSIYKIKKISFSKIFPKFSVKNSNGRPPPPKPNNYINNDSKF